MINPEIYNIKTADNYTEEEITELLNLATDRNSYDYIIDRLYFIGTEGKRHKTCCDDIPVLTLRSYLRRRKREILKYDILDDPKI